MGVLFLLAQGTRCSFSLSERKRTKKKQTTLRGTPNTHCVRIGEPLPPVDGLSALSYKTAPHSANNAARSEAATR